MKHGTLERAQQHRRDKDLDDCTSCGEAWEAHVKYLNHQSRRDQKADPYAARYRGPWREDPYIPKVGF